MDPIPCSLGLCAYNEEKNIGLLLDDILSQEEKVCRITEIVVVASGCTDGTETVVRGRAARDRRIRLRSERERRGKAAAINLFLSEAKSRIAIVFSTDVRLSAETLDRLVAPLRDHAVGVCGPHIIPTNAPRGFMSYYVHLYWQLHHRMALEYPRSGEIIAFRRVIANIPETTCSDETAITALVERQGYRTVYVPDALVYNRGPESVSDLILVRRRHLIGYFHIDGLLNYTSATTHNAKVFKVLIAELRDADYPLPLMVRLLYTAGVLACEAAARLLARWDWYVARQVPAVWTMAESTKEITDDALPRR